MADQQVFTMFTESNCSAGSDGIRYKLPNINPPAPLNVSALDIAEEWKIWKHLWDSYSLLTNLSSQPDSYQSALLLHSIGPDCVRIYNGMKFVNESESKRCSVILEKLGSHFLGKRREFVERFKFNRRNQESGENIDQYITVLRTMSKSCGFCECMKEKLLMDRLLLGVIDEKMREKMMAARDLTLSKALDICKAVEAASVQMKALKTNDVVHKVTWKDDEQLIKSSLPESSTTSYGQWFPSQAETDSDPELPLPSCSERNPPNEIIVQATNNRDGERKFDKRYPCVYCQVLHTQIQRHLRERHANEPDVMAIHNEQDKGKRSRLMELLRNKGVHRHNCQVVREGRGVFIVIYRPSREANYQDYRLCSYCLGYYVKSDLWKHSCRHKPADLPNSLTLDGSLNDITANDVDFSESSEEDTCMPKLPETEKHCKRRLSQELDIVKQEPESGDEESAFDPDDRNDPDAKEHDEEQQLQGRSQRDLDIYKQEPESGDEESAFDHDDRNVPDAKEHDDEQQLQGSFQRGLEVCNQDPESGNENGAFDPDDCNDPDPNEHDEEWQLPRSSKKGSKRRKSSPLGEPDDQLRKKYQKKMWSDREKAAVHRHLGAFMTVGSRLPGKSEIERCLAEPALKNRTWLNIKDFIRNTQSRLLNDL